VAGVSPRREARIDSMEQTGPCRVVAILAAYNEEDIVAAAVRHLIEQGVDVYFIDNRSTDATIEAVRPFVGNGVLAIETFPQDPVPDSADGMFRWGQILRRKEELASTLDADWFIHQDADEFRESPWRHLNLRDAITFVDRAGFNAIDFEVLNFQPTHDDFRAGDDVRTSFPYYEPGQSFNRVQVRCWKKTDVRVDLVSTGGHDVAFPGRSVFPVRFLLRHYPIRGRAHAQRKVFRDRRPRFDPDERAKGWHVQYDDMAEGQDFVLEPKERILFDPDTVRLRLILRHRGIEQLEARVVELEQRLQLELDASARTNQLNVEEIDGLRGQTAQLGEQLVLRAERVQALETEMAERLSEIARLERHAEERERRIGGLEADLAAGVSERDRLRGDLDAASFERDRLEGSNRDLRNALAGSKRRIDDLLGSGSWRVTAPFRALARLVMRRP
jgi:hypothetical protein